MVALGVRALGVRACASRCAASSRRRCCRSSIAGRACVRARPAPTSSRRSSASSARSRRRYGGYVVHLGIVLMFLGFAGEGFKREEQVRAQARAARRRSGAFVVTQRALRLTDDGQKQMVTAHMAVTRDGEAGGRAAPGEVVLPQARRGADDRGRDPPRRSPKTSTSSWPASRSQSQSATLHVVVNPLVNWIWVGLRCARARNHPRAAPGACVRVRAVARRRPAR